MLPNPQHPPVGPPQRAVHPRVAGLVPRNLLEPKRRIPLGPRPVPGTPMPETAIHKHGQPRPGKYKIRTHPKGRARHSVRAVFRLTHDPGPLHSSFCILNSDFKVPSPPPNPVRPQQPRQRHLRLLVPAAANPRHHLRPLLFGKHIRHLV